jgi:hypothetical protein
VQPIKPIVVSTADQQQIKPMSIELSMDHLPRTPAMKLLTSHTRFNGVIKKDRMKELRPTFVELKTIERHRREILLRVS